jgi:diguanylate cyclase (GGDEF)-like protein/PAS domain S-box-containing protein
MVQRAGVPASRGGAAAAPARKRPDVKPLRAGPQALATTAAQQQFLTLVEQASDGILLSNAQQQITHANSRICQLLGYEAEEIVGLDVLETYLPEEREQGRQRMVQMPPGTTMRFERLARRKDGSSVPVDVSVAWLPNGERQSVMRDVSEIRRAQEAARLEERRLRALVRISEFEAHSLQEMLDVALEEVVRLSDSVFGYIYYYDEDTELFTLHAWSAEVMESCSIPNPPTTYELARTGIWGEVVRQRRPIVVNDFVAAHPLKRGYPEGHAELTSYMSVPVLSRGRIVAVIGVANKAQPYTDLDVSHLTQMMDVVWKMAERRQAEDELQALAAELEVRVEQRTQEYEKANAELEAANTELAAANAELQKLLREEEGLQAELAYRALHDPLTGLANRAMFQERLNYALRISERGIGVLWIDLDRFKEVNDVFGHDAGDELLVAIADRLREMVRETDDIARMGGDEFAIVLPNVSETEGSMVADRILAALNDASALRLQVGASIGIGWQSPRAGGDGRALVKHADQAMYRAKAAGGGMALS